MGSLTDRRERLRMAWRSAGSNWWRVSMKCARHRTLRHERKTRKIFRVIVSHFSCENHEENKLAERKLICRELSRKTMS